MIGAWVPMTIGAALLQCLRTAQQKRLTGHIGQNGAHFARYLYGAPAAALLVVLLARAGADLPWPTAGFALYALLGGLAQIVATGCLIKAFTLRSFAVATTLSKTEAVQAALISGLVLGEPMSLIGWIAILIGLAGVILLTAGRAPGGLAAFWRGFSDQAAAYGLASGAFFALSSVSIRAASLSFAGGGALERASLTLALITAMQTLVMGLWLVLFDRPALKGALVDWAPSAATVGLMSVVGSFLWFYSMTLEPVAHVRALGQIEIIFTLLISWRGFRERPTGREIGGIGLIAGGVVTLVLLA